MSNDTDNKFQREPLKEHLTDRDDVYVVFDFFKTWDMDVPEYLKKASDEYSKMLDKPVHEISENDLISAQNSFRVALCRAIYDFKDEPVFQEELLSNAVENARQIVLFNDFNSSIEQSLSE